MAKRLLCCHMLPGVATCCHCVAFPFRIWLRLLERTRGCHEGRDRDAPQGRWDGIAYGIYGIPTSCGRLWPRPNLKLTLMEVFLALVDLVWYCELVYLVLSSTPLQWNISDWDLSGFLNPVWLVLITLMWLLDLASCLRWWQIKRGSLQHIAGTTWTCSRPFIHGHGSAMFSQWFSLLSMQPAENS